MARRAPDPPRAMGVPFARPFVVRLVEDTATRLGRPIPWTLPKVYLAPDMPTVWPGQVGAFVPPDAIYVQSRDEALIRHEMGRWFCHLAGHGGAGRRAAAWAMRAEGVPYWPLGYVIG